MKKKDDIKIEVDNEMASLSSKEKATQKESSLPYTGEPSMSARRKVAGKIDIGSGQVGNILIDSTAACAACFGLCTPGHCDCICECDSICGPCDCHCDCVCVCYCDCESDRGDMLTRFENQIAAIEKNLSSLIYQVRKIGNQMDMIATQGVVTGRRGAAISNRLTNIESIVKSRFGDIQDILSEIAKK
jgi:hypothetical protein